MSEYREAPHWQLLPGHTIWRSGFAFGAQYPSLEMTLQGEVLTELELEALSSRLIAALPTPSLAADWTAQPTTEGENSIAVFAKLLLLSLSHLQRSAGLPVFETGRVLFQDGAKARILIPTTKGSFKLIFDITNWIMRSCDVIRRDKEIGHHATLLPPLLYQLQYLFGIHSVSNQFIFAALRKGVPFVELPDKIYQYGQGPLSRRLLSSLTDETSNIAVHLSRHKYYAAQVLAEAGIPVPAHQLVRDEPAALRAADEIGYPVVVKPENLDGGSAVGADLHTPSEVSQAVASVLAKSTDILVEKHVPGRDYRVTVFRSEVIWAVERKPGGVVGDGHTSVKELVKRLNSDPRRQAAAHAPLKPVPLDDEAHSLLVRAGLTENSVPASGHFIRLRRTANVATGGVPVAVLDKMHPDNGLLAVRAARALGLDLAGVDILIHDIERSWLETGAAICDVNAGPDIGQATAAHLYEPILATLVRGTGRIPIILVVGSAKDSQLDCLVSKGIQLSHMTIGYHDRLGVRVGNERLTRGPIESCNGGRILIRDPRVEAIIMQVNDDGLINTGLPSQRYDLLIVAGSDVKPSSPKPSRSNIETARNLISALLPACDGMVMQLQGDELPLDDFRSLTSANWMGVLDPNAVETIICSEIGRLAKTHQLTAGRYN